MKSKKDELIRSTVTEDGKTQIVISISAEQLEDLLEQLSLFLMTEQNMTAEETKEAFQVITEFGDIPEDLLEQAIQRAEQQANKPVSEKLS